MNRLTITDSQSTVERENVELRKQLQAYMEFYFELLDSVICLSNRIYTMQAPHKLSPHSPTAAIP
ncbi:hypothetical protein, partial [Akkermansia sp.]|uniref:hypothetical protein n=1 Tax=Akkermansia sp. TaxID=1872421 RepID=UPI003AB3517C